MKQFILGLGLALFLLSSQAQTTQSGGGTGANIATCIQSPDMCLSSPIAKSCAAGMRWSTAGTGIAHCVANDPVCPASEKVVHDFYGNPSCVSRCAPSEYWNATGECRPCATTSTSSGSCQPGYEGTAYRSVTTNVCTGSTNYSDWDYSACTVPPTCGNGASNYPMCNVFPTCANGASNYPSCTSFAPNLASLPAVIHETGASAEAQLQIYADGRWRIGRSNCGDEDTPGWSAQEQWKFCTTKDAYGSLFLPGTNPADFEIRLTDMYRQTGSVRGDSNDPRCAGWQNITAQTLACSWVNARREISGHSGDSQDYSSPSDSSLQFTLNIRSRTNPAQVWSIKMILGATWLKGRACPYRGFCYD